MKILVNSFILVCAALSLSHASDPEEIVPFNVCEGVASGTRLPHDTDCGRFILCDGGYSMTLACRSTEPHFNRCTSTCVNDMSVCTLTSCPGSTTTTSTTTSSSAAPPDPQTTTTTTSTTEPPIPSPDPVTTTTSQTTTQPPAPTPGTTTTRFNPPTVPVDIPCVPDCVPYVEDTHKCGCEARWGCLRGTCQCNTATQCPFEDTAGACVSNCGCQANCNCPDNGTTDCVCHDNCKCVQPPDVCPFPKSQCVAQCSCEKRCNCLPSDDFCTCNANLAC